MAWAPKAVLAPTSISTYEQCPLKYRYQKIDKILEPPTVAINIGLFAHALLEKIFQLPIADRNTELLYSDLWWDEAYQQIRNDKTAELFDQLLRENPEINFRDETNKIIDTYLKLEDPKAFASMSEQEAKLSAEFSEDLNLFGFADRIDHGKNGEIRIVDYKTGKKPASGFSSEYIFQLNYYALTYYKMHGKLPQDAALLFLKPNESEFDDLNGWIKIQPTPESIQEVSDKIAKIWENIKDNCKKLKFDPTPNVLCGWCSYQNICPAENKPQNPKAEPIKAYEGKQPELTKEKIEKSLHISI